MRVVKTFFVSREFQKQNMICVNSERLTFSQSAGLSETWGRVWNQNVVISRHFDPTAASHKVRKV